MGIGCDEIRDLVIISLYGKATTEQAREIQEHIRACQVCARICDRLKAHKDLFETDEDIPLPDWAMSWKVIADRALRRRGRSWFASPRTRPLRVAATLALMLVVGFVLGRWFLFQAPGRDTQVALSDYRPISACEFAQQVDLLLVDFMNRQDPIAGGKIRELERKIMEETLFQTRLLKMLASRRNDAVTRDVLEDVELALVGISNLTPGDRQSARQLYDFIYRSRLGLRLREMADMRPPT